jgi:hypothetical protein
MTREFARNPRRGPFKTCGKTMLKPVTAARLHTHLADMGVIRVLGVDAVKFLQGQVSNDVTKLAEHVSVLAGLHNAQGRAIALLRFIRASDDEVLAILPRELAGVVAARLAKFVLRAKAKVLDVSLEWEISGVEGGGVEGEIDGAALGAARRDEDGSLWVRVGAAPARWLVATPVTAAHGATSASATTSANTATSASPTSSATPASSRMESLGSLSRDEWRAFDIADGVPQVYAATSEAFVAQMLNLDVVGGISFEKGCYTGQEVIARAHYRGKVKRRMQRFLTAGQATLKAGDSGALKDGRSYKVVEAVQRKDGRCEFLAVTTVGASDGEISEDSPAVATNVATTASVATTGNVAALDAEQLPLPYSLPA